MVPRDSYIVADQNVERRPRCSAQALLCKEMSKRDVLQENNENMLPALICGGSYLGKACKHPLSALSEESAWFSMFVDPLLRFLLFMFNSGVLFTGMLLRGS